MSRELAERLRTYLFEGLIPFTARAFVDRRQGGFHERVDALGNPVHTGYKRLVVQCRQVYFFSHAFLLAQAPQAIEEARQGVAFLQRSYWDVRHGGWFFSTSPEGAPRERRKDCYGHAFVLFAMAYFHRASGDAGALLLAERTLQVLQERFVDESHGGYLEAAAEDWSALGAVRRQNPHMHLLEGLLAMYEAAGGSHYLRLAGDIVRLFREKLFDHESGTLGEHFLDDWTPHPKLGHRVEPGHHFEWCWLLDWYARVASDTVATDPVSSNHGALSLSERLFTWAMRHGLDRDHGGVFDAVSREGEVLEGTKRIWPQLECVKACAVRYQRSGETGDLRALTAQLEALFSRYLIDDGSWRESLDRQGRPASDTLPGSTGYHLFLALSEVLRVLEGRAPEDLHTARSVP